LPNVKLRQQLSRDSAALLARTLVVVFFHRPLNLAAGFVGLEGFSAVMLLLVFG
jgi:hypothetical protein